MREVYELTSLVHPLLATSAVINGATKWVSEPEAAGVVLGCWRTELGQLGRRLILRRFDDSTALAAERHRALVSSDPFHGAGAVTALDMASYAPFPFLPRMAPNPRDAVFEFRTYKLKPGGLPPTLAGWEKALGMAKDYAPHLRINLYALDGTPRIVHIWGFNNLEQRQSLRQAAYETGVWPPPGGPENIADAMAMIAIPMTMPTAKS